MNTTEAAEAIGTTPRNLRQFLRSPMSSFQPVGSGARYEFDLDQLDGLRSQFQKWSANGSPRSSKNKPGRPQTPADIQEARDIEVWEEEGWVEIPDIRDPRVRAQVRREAAEAERRLSLQLIAAGLHITQGGVK